MKQRKAESQHRKSGDEEKRIEIIILDKDTMIYEYRSNKT